MSDINKEQTSPSGFLRFACDCVSHLHDSTRDPWSHVTRAGLISSETKEIILNKTYRRPKTVTQLSKEIGLSQPAIHKHVKELLASDIMREATLPDTEKSYRVEQYYEPNFPVLFADDLDQLEPACQKVAQEIAKIYWEYRGELQEAFSKSSLEGRGYTIEDILDYLYSAIRRKGREILNTQKFFSELPTHKDGSRWVYWAEEVLDVDSECQ